MDVWRNPGMTVKVNKRRLKKCSPITRRHIIQFNIDTIESCTQLLANVDVPILEIGALNTQPCGYVHRRGLR